MNKNIQTPFWFLTISIFIGLIVPVLIQDGMFMDAMLYTCVSNNLGNDIGSFWNPIFSETWNKAGRDSFHEHPPLIFGIQAIFYKIFGNSIYVERFYTFLTACSTAFLISLIWKLITKGKEKLQKLSWLPILLWITIPVTFWSFRNNMQENTMGVFILLAVYFALKALHSESKIYLNLIRSGIFIFLASLSKGVPGFFPIGIVGFYWLIERKISFSKTILYTLVLIITPAIIYSILLSNSEIYESLSFYVRERLINRIDANPTVDNRFSIVFRLLQELIPAISITFILWIYTKLNSVKVKLEKQYINKILLQFAIGFMGALPIMLTLIQKGFYMVYALPFFGIGFALIIAPTVAHLISKINTKKKSFKVFKLASIVILISVIIFSSLQKGKTSRNKELLEDIYLIGKVVPESSIINIDISMWNNWDMQCYLIRHFNISVDHSQENIRNYFLLEKNINYLDMNSYELVTLPTKRFNLYKHIK